MKESCPSSHLWSEHAGTLVVLLGLRLSRFGNFKVRACVLQVVQVEASRTLPECNICVTLPSEFSACLCPSSVDFRA